VIEVRGLTKRYGSTVAVDRLSFDVPPGAVTGFLGLNGSGKSTTMRMILGLDAPDAGHACIGGQHRLMHLVSGRRAPGSTRNALTRLPSGRRIRLMEIEHDVPDIPDRQVQLADGFLNLPGSRMIAHQPQCHFESEPGGEQPVHHEVGHAPGDAVAVLHQEQHRVRPVACPPGRGIARRPYARLV